MHGDEPFEGKKVHAETSWCEMAIFVRIERQVLRK